MFKDKILLITGGTGFFGNAVLDRFLLTEIQEIRIFSRDEKKQDDMRHEYQAKYPGISNKIKFYIGDVRDIQSIRAAMFGVDYVFHAAALKQVPSCEFFPLEAVKTNVLGTENVLGKQELTITEPQMTRFLMSLEEAVELVLYAFQNANAGDIMVQKAPACTIGVLAQAISEIFEVDLGVHVIGIRHGEKMHETLLTGEE